MKISAVWIVKNEAANLDRSIKSLAEAVDEMVVVDTGSSDGTADVALALGARVERYEWANDFAAARNFARSFATGDIIIFLDADEWFDPALGAAGREYFTDLFKKYPKLDSLSVPLRNVDARLGVMDTSVVTRVFRNTDRVRYEGAVHEHLAGSAKSAVADKFSLNHSGYDKAVLKDKVARNLALLESGLAGSAEGSRNWARFKIYLVRENYILKRHDVALAHLADVFKYPAQIRKLCAYHSEDFVNNIYYAALLAAVNRGGVSRREIRDKLFALFTQVYPMYAGTPEAGLLYQAYFDMKEDRFLKEFDPMVKLSQQLDKYGLVTYYKSYERYIYEKAAIASWRRGDRLAAMERSATALKSGGKRLSDTLMTILLTCVKGQPAADVILFLNSIYDPSDINKLDMLVKRTRIDGMRDVFSYYAKKRMDAGSARTGVFCSAMLANGKYEAAAGAAAQFCDGGDASAAIYLLAATVCGAPREIIEASQTVFLVFGHILDAYRDGTRLETVSALDAQTLRKSYGLVAFSAGFETADRFLRVFAADPALCFGVKAAYCVECHRSELLLDEDMSGISDTDVTCRRYFAQALLEAGRYEEAAAQAERVLAAEIIDETLLHILCVTAEKSEGAVRDKAARLYADYMKLYDMTTDTRDIVNTGYVYEDEGEGTIPRGVAALKKMTQDTLDKVFCQEKEILVTKELLDLTRKAAEVYKSKRLFTEAIRCMCRSIAHGGDDVSGIRESLAWIFDEVKNKELAEYVRGI